MRCIAQRTPLGRTIEAGPPGPASASALMRHAWTRTTMTASINSGGRLLALEPRGGSVVAGQTSAFQNVPREWRRRERRHRRESHRLRSDRSRLPDRWCREPIVRRRRCSRSVDRSSRTSHGTRTSPAGRSRRRRRGQAHARPRSNHDRPDRVRRNRMRRRRSSPPARARSPSCRQVGCRRRNRTSSTGSKAGPP